MKFKQQIFLCLLPVLCIAGEVSDSNASRPTLDEIEVQGSQLSDSNLLRAAVLGEDTLRYRQVNSLGDLNGLSPNLHLSGNGIKSFGDVLFKYLIFNSSIGWSNGTL